MAAGIRVPSGRRWSLSVGLARNVGMINRLERFSHSQPPLSRESIDRFEVWSRSRDLDVLNRRCTNNTEQQVLEDVHYSGIQIEKLPKVSLAGIPSFVCALHIRTVLGHQYLATSMRFWMAGKSCRKMRRDWYCSCTSASRDSSDRRALHSESNYGGQTLTNISRAILRPPSPIHLPGSHYAPIIFLLLLKQEGYLST